MLAATIARLQIELHTGDGKRRRIVPNYEQHKKHSHSRRAGWMGDPIQQTVAATFAELGAADPKSISRTLLLRDPHFLGHRFQSGDLNALWVPGSNEIEFHDGNGKLLRTVSWEEQKKAAA